MRRETLTWLAARLSQMPCQVPWTEQTEEFYSEFLDDVPDAVLVRAVRVICRMPGRAMRPQPGEILEIIASERAADGMTASDAYREAARFRSLYGRYAAVCRAAPERYPGIRDIGPPRDLNRAVLDTIDAIGGWDRFCDIESEHLEVQVSQFRRAWDDRSRGVGRKVAEHLTALQEERQGRQALAMPAAFEEIIDSALGETAGRTGQENER